MDIGSIKQDLLELRKILLKKEIHLDLVLLYGSQARNQAHSDSDIDVAIVSRDFGKDKFNESVQVNLEASKLNSAFEIKIFTLNEYMDPLYPSPLLSEIKKTGIALF